MEIWDPYDWSIVFERMTHDEQAMTVVCAWILIIAVIAFAWTAARNKKKLDEAERLLEQKESEQDAPAPLADESTFIKATPVDENIFADVYKMENATVPKHSALQMVICPRCNWKGSLDETVSTYGHTICPYCHEEFKEIVR